MEPQWRQLRMELGDSLRWRYRMGGMIPDWRGYEDPVNAVSRPAQMGPLWFQVRAQTGVPLDERIWQEDPPASSYPACLAVKAAERQGAEAAERYLRRLREAGLLERRNIARRDVLLAIADELAAASMEFDFDSARFCDELDADETAASLREDVKEAAYLRIGRFPTLVMRRDNGGPALLLTGYRPFSVLLAACHELASDLLERTEPAPPADLVTLVARWERSTAADVAALSGMDLPAAQAALDTAVARGILHADATGYLFGLHRTARSF